jgi:hypothetical protein
MAKAFLGVIVLALSLSFTCPALAAKPEPAPKWAQLNSEQQKTLAPLAHDWDGFTDFRKKKWVGIAKRYPGMQPAEQQRLQTRMREWASLTTDQRRRAREGFKNFEQLPPEKKLTMRQKWEEYQRLPESEKRRLAESAAKSPPAPKVRAPRSSTAKSPATTPQLSVPLSTTPANANSLATPLSASTGTPESAGAVQNPATGK